MIQINTHLDRHLGRNSFNIFLGDLDVFGAFFEMNFVNCCKRNHEYREILLPFSYLSLLLLTFFSQLLIMCALVISVLKYSDDVINSNVSSCFKRVILSSLLLVEEVISGNDRCFDASFFVFFLNLAFSIEFLTSRTKQGMV